MSARIDKYLLLLLLGACQIKGDLPAPDEGFIKNFGDSRTYQPADLVYLPDSTGLIIFGSEISEDGIVDFSWVRASLSGTFDQSSATTLRVKVPLTFDADGDGALDSARGDASAGKIRLIESGPLAGDYIFVGNLFVDQAFDNGEEIVDVNVPVIGFLDPNLEPIKVITLKNGEPQTTGRSAFARDVVQTSDGNFVIGLSYEINKNANNSGPADLDFVLQKYEYAGTGDPELLWQESEILALTNEDEILCGLFEKNNGNLVVIGTTTDASARGETGGNNGRNVTFVELTPTAGILRSITYGIGELDETELYDDVANVALQTNAGFAVAGTSTINDRMHVFFMNLTQNGDFIAGDTVPSAIDPALETRGLGMVQTADKDFVILGIYTNFFNGGEGRLGEALFMRVSPSGRLKSEANFGSLAGSDEAVDGLLLGDKKIMTLARMDFGAQVELISLIKTNADGLFTD